MRYSINDFINELKDVINEINKETVNRKNGISGDGTVEQLNFFLDELQDLLKNALSNSIPPRGQRNVTFTWYITDSWDLTTDSNIRKKLMNLADNYKRKLI